MLYPIIKALHLCMVIAWFAGLFYLPRIFVNLAMAETPSERTRLNLMAAKLYRFMTPLGALAVLLGLWLWFGFGISGGWLHAKVTLVAGLIGYHHYCGRLVKRFAAGIDDGRSHVWYRVFNELPVLVMFAVVFLVILKPF